MKPSSSELLSLPLDSEHRQETAEAGKEKAGDSVQTPVCVWFEPRSAVLNFVGFFAPFGTKNSFCNRLIFSPMFRHFFVYDVTLAGSHSGGCGFGCQQLCSHLRPSSRCTYRNHGQHGFYARRMDQFDAEWCWCRLSAYGHKPCRIFSQMHRSV